MQTSDRKAPGAPGIAPRWTSSAKDGLGATYNTGSRRVEPAFQRYVVKPVRNAHEM